MKKLSRALKAARKARHWTQADVVQALRNLADADGNSRGLLTTTASIVRWENGSEPQPETMAALIEVFPVELAEFAPKAIVSLWAQTLRRARLAAKMTHKGVSKALEARGQRRSEAAVQKWEKGRVPEEAVLDVLDDLFPALKEIARPSVGVPAGATEKKREA
jgi:transcriptional regulator with XRE-family HTH domain